MVCDLEGRPLDAACKASAELPLHCRLYQLDESVGAVLHTHSVTSTVLSRRAGPAVRITGFEMQKALGGVTTHEDEISVPVFDNDQDLDALAENVASAWARGDINVPGFLIAGHGLYAWGRDITEAERHVEGFEFLFDCLWQENLVQGP